jgi:hypothetical protein
MDQVAALFVCLVIFVVWVRNVNQIVDRNHQEEKARSAYTKVDSPTIEVHYYLTHSQAPPELYKRMEVYRFVVSQISRLYQLLCQDSWPVLLQP